MFKKVFLSSEKDVWSARRPTSNVCVCVNNSNTIRFSWLWQPKRNGVLKFENSAGQKCRFDLTLRSFVETCTRDDRLNKYDEAVGRVWVLCGILMNVQEAVLVMVKGREKLSASNVFSEVVAYLQWIVQMDCTVRSVKYPFLFFNYLSFFIGPAPSKGSNKRPIIFIFPRTTSVGWTIVVKLLF